MTRIPLAYESADISALARSLKQQLTDLGEMPSHVQMLNMLAKAGGYRNFQHFRATAEASPVPAVAPPPPMVINEKRAAAVANHFGADGQLLRWPSKTNHQELCCWVLWSRLPDDLLLDERHISLWLNDQHEFGDAAILRRTMVTMGLMTRTDDGRDYRKVHATPPPELAVVLGRLAA